MTKTFYEFFAGGGMARAGLGDQWTCLFANDFDHKKSEIYRANWGDEVIRTADVRALTTATLPGAASLVWASFPCQDLSLAGAGAGLRGERSGTYWPFWELMRSLVQEGRAPKVIVLENVCGTLTSHAGRDFTAICESLYAAGYRFGAIVIDAVNFVPQSRPRLFIVGVRDTVRIPSEVTTNQPRKQWHTVAVQKAWASLPVPLRESWIWWSLPLPDPRGSKLSQLIEESPKSVKWHTSEETEKLLSMMNPIHTAKVEAAKKLNRPVVGTVYKRTRTTPQGVKAQRAEVRFDDIAGCLRTPMGGSSRQTILVINGPNVRSRLLSTREAARLMGLPDSYTLPTNYNEAYHLLGDGLAVPVVRYLAASIIEPLVLADDQADLASAA